jgi:hypothetical protein
MSLKSIYRKYETYLSNSSQRLRVRKQYTGEWMDILFGKDAKLVRSTKLTATEKKETEDYWKKNFGKKIPLLWHRKYKAYSGKMDKRYFPEYLYTCMLEPKMQEDRIARTINDKNLTEFLFDRILKNSENIEVPRTICGCSHGYYFDEDRNPISREKCADIVKKLKGEFIIKPAVGESSGHGVRLLKMQQGIDKESNQNAEEIIRDYRRDFIVQEKIKQHTEYARLNPSSVNTIRVFTYRKGTAIKAAPPIMRIGRDGNYLDNAHAGGIYIAVREDSSMGEYALDCDGKKYEKHPDTGIVFSKFQIPYVKEVVETAKKCHVCLPEITFANWDFSVAEDNKIILIEVNLSCPGIWVFQNAHGVGVFGDDSEYMIKRLKGVSNAQTD